MKWFKHDSDMHTDLKIQALIQKYGTKGYAVWIVCLELLAKEGHKGRLKAETCWKEGLKNIFWEFSENGKVELDNILFILGDLKLICPKSLKEGDLFISNFKKRADEYTTKVIGIQSRQSPDNVVLDKIRLDKIRIEYIKIKGLDINNFSTDDFGRTAKAIKTLVFKAKDNDDLVVKSLRWASQKGWCDWTLETIIRKWPDFMKERGRIREEPKPDLACPICGGKGKIQEGSQKGAQCLCVH